MNWETIYKENINRKFQEIQEITSTFTLKTSINNLNKTVKKVLVFVSIVFITLLVIAFHSSIDALLSAILLLFILITFSYFFNSYKIKINKEKIKINANGEEINIQIKRLKNIYLEENYYRIFFRKKKNYSLVILYETEKHDICDIRLTTFLLSKEKLKKWFSTIKLKQNKVNNQKKCIQYKRKRIFRKIIIYSIFILLTFIIIKFHNIF